MLSLLNARKQFFLFLFRLGSVCSHVAALLFKLQTCSQMELNKAACTSKLCEWKQSRQHAEAAPLKMINLRRPKKGSLPMEIPSYHQAEPPYSSKDPKIYGNSVATERLKELKKIAPKAAVFSSIAESDEGTDSDGTDTADEDEQNSVPEPLTSLFQPAAINDTKEELENRKMKLYYLYERSYCQSQYYNLCQITRVQILSKTWQLHRAGRITASIAKQAFNADSINDRGYPKTFMTSIMQYGDEVDVPATIYGKAMEPVARKSFIDYAENHHDGFIAKDTGLHVLKDKPFLGASPDGLIECACHGKGVLEIKCPYKYKNGLDGWSPDESFPVSPDGVMRRKHAYFFQVQHQMLITNR